MKIKIQEGNVMNGKSSFISISGGFFCILLLMGSQIIQAQELIEFGKVIVTDDPDYYVDLSNQTDIDAANDRELTIRWNFDSINVKDIHIYVQTDNEGKIKYLGRTGDGAAASFSWREGNRLVAGEYKNGPQANHSYRFGIYLLQERGPQAAVGPYFTAGPVKYQVEDISTPTPTPTQEAEETPTPVKNKPTPKNTPTPKNKPTPTVTPTATPVPDFNCILPGDYYMEEATAETFDLVYAEANCALLHDGTPVPLQLILGESSGVMDLFIPWSGKNASRLASITFDQQVCPTSGPKTARLYLYSANDVKLKAYDDNGNLVDTTLVKNENKDEDDEDSIRNNASIQNVVLTISVHANKTQVEPVTLSSKKGIRVIEMEGEEILLHKICWSCSVANFKPTPTPTIAPSGSVTVTDDINSTIDLSNSEDIDTSNERELVVRWQVSGYSAKDYHVYVQVDGSSKMQYLGRPGDGQATYYRWNSNSRIVTGPFKKGPESGHSYLFSIYAINSKPFGPIKAAGPVKYTVSETPPAIPTDSVIVTDDLNSFVDLSNGEDRDLASDRELVVRWNFPNISAKDVHIYTLLNNMGRLQYIGRTESGDVQAFQWRQDNRLVAGPFKKGPQSGNQYRFYVYFINNQGPKAVSGPFAAAGPVAYIVEQATPTPTPPIPIEEPTPTPTETPTPTPTETPSGETNPTGNTQ